MITSKVPPHFPPVEMHVPYMSPVINSTHIPSDLFGRTAMALGETFYAIYRKWRSMIMVQVVSVTLLQPLDPKTRSGSGATEETIGLELLLFN